MDEPRAVRRAAFQALFQLDARNGRDSDMIESSLESCEGLSASGRRKAQALAQTAWEDRAAADAAMEALAPTWPAKRQAAVDRAILRLAHHEITSGRVSPAIAINEAVELAKEFGTEKSPGFVNALLDRIARDAAAPSSEGAATP